MDTENSLDTRLGEVSGTAVAHPDAPCGSDEARIIDAVEDQLGDHWIRFGRNSRALWVSVRDLLLDERQVFGKFSGPGMTFLTSTAKNDVKKLIENHVDYRKALVASRPGWLAGENVYVFPDGSYAMPHTDNPPEIIIAFEPLQKFSPKKNTKVWQRKIGPLVKDQPLPLFVLAFAFIGPLLRFAPSDYVNPQIELVGPRETGKSTLAALAASVWAGDPGSETGGGDSWDLTLNAVDPLKIAHADNLLVLDEANLLGCTKKQQAEIMETAVFKLATTGMKKRFTDTRATTHVKLALISTSNLPLAQLINSPEVVQAAAQSRLITIPIRADQGHGAFETIPSEFSTARDAAAHLRNVVNEQYGQAGRRFIGRLVKEVAQGEEALRSKIRNRLEKFLSKFWKWVPKGTSARVAKLFAMTYVAGSLARDWKILPKEWGSLSKAVRAVASIVVFPCAGGLSALDRVRQYARKHASELEKVADLPRPLKAKDFEKHPGLLATIDERRAIVIPAKVFQRAFPDHQEVMRELKQQGLAKVEGGKDPKLTIKAPRALSDGGRAYCIFLK